jgi:LacI family transcriptional regulator
MRAARESSAWPEESRGIEMYGSKGALALFVAMIDRPTAIIAVNMVAFGTIASLGARGFLVPTDVSAVGSDGLNLGARFNLHLITVRQSIAEMGGIAIDLAEKKAGDGSAGRVVLRPELLVRASTAGPRS